MASQLKTEPVEKTPTVEYFNGVPILFTEEPPIRPVEWFGKVPLLYEDDDEGDMGESNPHASSNMILFVCLGSHFANRPQYQVFSDMNLYYPPPDLPKGTPIPYVSPDTMIVEPYKKLDDSVSSYTVGKEGPAPRVTFEVLSKRSAQQRDLKEKVNAYALMGVEEYILIDVTGKFLRQKLLLKRLQSNGTYVNERDEDGGVTSKLGFRLVIDSDGRLRIINTATGKPYLRPLEAEAKAAEADAKAAEADAKAAEAQAKAAEAEAKATEGEAKNRELQAEVAKLREMVAKQKASHKDRRRQKRPS